VEIFSTGSQSIHTLKIPRIGKGYVHTLGSKVMSLRIAATTTGRIGLVDASTVITWRTEGSTRRNFWQEQGGGHQSDKRETGQAWGYEQTAWACGGRVNGRVQLPRAKTHSARFSDAVYIVWIYLIK
jgi:hypothetical protein